MEFTWKCKEGRNLEARGKQHENKARKEEEERHYHTMVTMEVAQEERNLVEEGRVIMSANSLHKEENTKRGLFEVSKSDC